MTRTRASLCVAAIIAIVLLSVGMREVRRAFWREPSESASPVTVTVPEGSSLGHIAGLLKEADIIESPRFFSLFARFMDYDTKLEAGNFSLLPKTNYTNLLLALTKSSTADVVVTIPEGFTLKQIGDRLVALFPSSVTADEWQNWTGPESPLMLEDWVAASGKPAGVDLEGYFFPDTYHFTPDATTEEIVRTLASTMKKRLDAVGVPSVTMSGYSLHNRLTLASIIEREVRTPGDMSAVGDVFRKRLEDGIALQSDATLNYVLDTGNPSLTFNTLQYDSPYNTYRYPGLPPGPISNPGLAALEAAWHPSANEYYYFLTDDAGTVYYARTFTEHVNNKARYLK